jgi:hypothetical protein
MVPSVVAEPTMEGTHIDLGRRAHPEPTTDCLTLLDIAVSNRRLRRALHSQLGDDGGSNLPYLRKSSRTERILQESSASADAKKNGPLAALLVAFLRPYSCVFRG